MKSANGRKFTIKKYLSNIDTKKLNDYFASYLTTIINFHSLQDNINFLLVLFHSTHLD